jgi:hypothetical protein
MSLVGLLILVLVLGLVAWLIFYVIDAIPLPPPFAVVAKALLALIIILILLGQLGLFGGTLFYRPLPPLR